MYVKQVIQRQCDITTKIVTKTTHNNNNDNNNCLPFYSSTEINNMTYLGFSTQMTFAVTLNLSHCGLLHAMDDKFYDGNF